MREQLNEYKERCMEYLQDVWTILCGMLLFMRHKQEIQEINHFFHKLFYEDGKDLVMHEMALITRPGRNTESLKDCTFCTYHARGKRKRDCIQIDRVSFFKDPNLPVSYRSGVRALRRVIPVMDTVAIQDDVWISNHVYHTLSTAAMILITMELFVTALLGWFWDPIMILCVGPFIAITTIITNEITLRGEDIADAFHDCEFQVTMISDFLRSVHYPMDELYDRFTTNEPFGNFYVCSITDRNYNTLKKVVNIR